MAEMFISPAFRVVNILKSFEKFIPQSSLDDLQWCIDQISNGEIYSCGKPNIINRAENVITQDSLLVLNYFTSFEKSLQIINDESLSSAIFKQRSVQRSDTMLISNPTLLDVDIDVEDIRFNIWDLYNNLGNRNHILRLVANKTFER